MESNILTALFLPIGLAAIMVGMGLTLDDIRRVVVYPKAAAVGVVGQVVFLPLLGFLIASMLPLEAALPSA